MSSSPASGTHPKTRLRVAINNIDYSFSSSGPLDKSELPKSPVLRVYGNSSVGTKTCVHIHQVFPYFYLDYLGSLHPKEVKHYTRRLTHSLNHAIALSLKRNPASPSSQHIRAAILVKGIPFYGFHPSYSPFLKVLVADPALVGRATTILRSGIVMKTRFQIYESHVSFPLQFLCDFGLYGCGFMDISGGWERCTDDAVDAQLPEFKRSPHYRQSRLPLEVDIIAPQILNRHNLSARTMRYQSGVTRPDSVPNEQLVVGVKELWEDERNRRRAKGLNPSPEVPVELSDSSRGNGGEWVGEARYWEAIRKRIESERPLDPYSGQPEPWEGRVMTTFESIEVLWDKEWTTWKPDMSSLAQAADQEAPENDTGEDTNMAIEVDEGLLSREALNAEELGAELRENPVYLGEHGDIHGEEGEQDEDEHEEDRDLEHQPELVEEDPFEVHEMDKKKPEEDIEYRLKSPPPPASASDLPRFVSPTPVRQGTPLNLATSDEDDIATRSSQNEHSGAELSLNGKRKIISQEEERGSSRKRRKVDFNSAETQEFKGNEVKEKERTSLIAVRAVNLSHAIETCKATNSNRYQFVPPPPSLAELKQSYEQRGVSQRIYQVPYFSNPTEIPEKPREYGGLLFHLKGNNVRSLEEWQSPIDSAFRFLSLESAGVAGWEYASHPPSVREARRWLHSNNGVDSVQAKRQQSQIEGPTQANIYGFKNSLLDAGQANRESSDMNILGMEVFAPSEGERSADPEQDEIVAVFYALHVSGETSIRTGIIAVNTPPLTSSRMREFSIEYAENELDLINRVIDTVVNLDPDIITGWEVQRGSWGYLDRRAKELGLDLGDMISRAPHGRGSRSEQWGFRKTSTFHTVGRHVFNAWRIMRSEQTLSIYTFENVAFHVLHTRVPRYTSKTLSRWYHSPAPADTSQLLHYLMKKTYMTLEMLEEIEIVTKTAEFARVFGVDFFSVISRGSQFKVESFMFRIAKPESFVLISPSKADVGKQNAAECMPLIMEPLSALYTSPLVVLDFQSLYPSIMIAYNYCYSTCLGRVQDFQGTYKFGVIDHTLPEGALKQLEDNITVAANGIMYVKSNIRRGLLGRMLVELLDTRVMVKQSMKGVKNDKALKRILDARQLALKYIANVTYGYTSASFSGRMPAVEIADSIVQSGRETLEKAIMLVNNTKKWGAQVVYGDTDSMFIYLRGRTKDEAFRIGYEIADTVTAMNPAPIKLKFEKVYFPCVLMAKKRYVGFKYEAIDATEPAFDAKGIETVRRDGVLAQRKMTETCLKLLFRTRDLSQIKSYCCRSFMKLLENKANPQDFIFAKEVKMGTYSENGPPPPGVVVAARKTVQDPNYEAQYGERVPYLIAKGEPGARLVDRAVDPTEFFEDGDLQLDAEYYINRVLIPPLDRILSLVGADVKQWYRDMPKPNTTTEVASPRKNRASISPEKPRMEEHFGHMQCAVCGGSADQELCDVCNTNSDETIVNLGGTVHDIEQRVKHAHEICASCAGSALGEPIECESFDCPWYYDRHRADDRFSLVPMYEGASEVIQWQLEDSAPGTPEEMGESVTDTGESEETSPNTTDSEDTIKA
ncbi:hypothetical protein FA15DRAFT_607802 [Coprinopsis marcescibilis]|uniref:DNA polymerase n=1 Tax=Coprinopsis marcescibilis TaxID=230819 RepID=A0A5C3LBK7_COPMA|nr:hypothetical protein FA15DRAFT_607802 [Coprinopsis marcescibilis]